MVGLADRVRPAVVSIAPYMKPPSFKVRRGGARRTRPIDTGTGVIIDGERGLIVTNSHVVKDMDRVQIRLFNDKIFIGDILGMDEETDLAVVKIDITEPLPFVKLADSSKLKVGQLAIAIGNPLGLTNTMTFGIISGLNRENIHLSRYEDFIQTDASINPGNSGGPLINIKGEIIGINTAIISYAQNVGFSIPSNMVKQIVTQLIEMGEVQRGWLGVGIEPVTYEIAVEFDVKEGEGVYVNAVFEGDPSHKAGLMVGDIILKVGGAPVNSSRSMVRIVGAISPGQRVDLDVVREGQSARVPVTLGSMKKPTQVAFVPKNTIRSLGILVNDLQETVKEEIGIVQDKEGVVVTEVFPRGRAHEGGLEKEDLIMAINGQEVKSRAQFKKIISRISSARDLLLAVDRDNESLEITLPGKG